MLRCRIERLLFLFALLAGWTSAAVGQVAEQPAFGFPGEFGNLDLADEFGDLDAPVGDPIELESFVVPASETEPALLVVRARVAKGWHVTSLTQQPPVRATKIAIEDSKQFKFLAGFEPLEKPEVDFQQEIYPDLPLENHYGQVNWVAPIQIAKGVDPATIKIKGELPDGQVCDDEDGICMQFGFSLTPKFTARLATADQIASVRPPARVATGDFDDVESKVVVRGHIEPQVVAPGGTAKLMVTLQPQEGWHIYHQADEIDPLAPYRPTLIVLTTTSGLPVTRPIADTEIIVADQVRYHDGTTTWTMDIPVPAGAEAGEYKVEGHLAYLVCSDKTCLAPSGVKFRGNVQVGPKIALGESPLTFDPDSYGAAKKALETSITWHIPSAGDSDNNAIAPTEFWANVFGKFGFEQQASGEWGAYPGKKTPEKDEPLWGMTFTRGQLIWLCGGLSFLASFAAGLILNVMPCVLPVVGLKIMSFAQQGGESRMQVFTLNLWYSLGLLAVFLVIATFAAVLHMLGQTLAWGEHLGDPRFAVPLLALVFVLGLSMFGVWEIPIPGFAGSGTASELASKEGPLGAFFKGVLTTILATPCGGPFIGLAVGIAVIAPIWLNYTIFTCMAIGMAAPYLIVGAFPNLVSFIPKPGPWMDGFKQFMGFVLMATAIWIVSFLADTYVIAALSLMVGLGIVCWIIGRTPITATFAQKMKRYASSGVVAVLSVLLFMWMLPNNSETSTELAWEEFTRATLDDRVDQGHAILVDFTADW